MKVFSPRSWLPASPPIKLSLRTLLILPFMLQIFGTVGLVSYLSFKNGQKAVNDLANQLMEGVSDRVDQHLSSYLNTAQKLSQTNKDAIELSLVTPQDLEKMGHFFWKQMQSHEIGYVLYGTPAGEFAGAGYYLNNDRVTIDELNPQRYGDRDVRVYSTDDQGNRTKIVDLNKNYAFQKEGWYADALQARKPVWSRVYQWEVAPYPLSIAAAQPIYDRDRTLTGVTAVEQRLSQVSDFLQTLKVSPSAPPSTAAPKESLARIFILERSGLLVASSSQQEQPFTLVQGKPVRLKASDSQDPQIRATTAALIQQFQGFERIQNGKQTTFWLQDQRQFVQVRPWRDALGLDWIVVVVVPEAEFMEQININSRNTALLCLLALAIAILVGIVTVRRLSRPLLQLSQASQGIAAGHLDRTVDERGVHEIAVLAQSFNQMSRQLRQSFVALETANQQLENRVEARTIELKAANAEISSLNDQLTEENLRMGTELDVARRLQQMILPEAKELAQIPDLDIAGFMEVVTEVGGDYYDVIPQNGCVTIGIGDVTGHGLESGVLMIMAQTAVRTLVAAHEYGSDNPAKFLGAVNQAIYQNAQRMSPGKNLSLAVLNYQNGQLKITGQHEEVLVVRSTGTVERIDTIDLGFPIGMIDNIDAFIAQAQVSLNFGDTVVLYTDGITEAGNGSRQLYGLDRLIEVIQQHRTGSASEIRQAVINDVHRHIGTEKVHDDITLVVLKRKTGY